MTPKVQCVFLFKLMYTITIIQQTFTEKKNDKIAMEFKTKAKKINKK